MNLGQLYQYLGELIEAGTDRRLTITLPGLHPEALPQELSEVMAVEGAYEADPAPLAKGYTERTGAVLLFHGVGFDMDTIKESHVCDWPLVEPPQPESTDNSKAGS